MSALEHIAHLVRRFVGSLSPREPTASDASWARSHLLPSEAALWEQMTVQDRRHSLLVARRFATLVGQPTRTQLAAGLLHDVGKSQSQLGTLGRVVATVVGPRTKRFRRYHDHERLGSEMLRTAGSDPETLSLIDGTDRLSEVLRQADNV